MYICVFFLLVYNLIIRVSVCISFSLNEIEGSNGLFGYEKMVYSWLQI